MRGKHCMLMVSLQTEALHITIFNVLQNCIHRLRLGVRNIKILTYEILPSPEGNLTPILEELY